MSTNVNYAIPGKGSNIFKNIPAFLEKVQDSEIKRVLLGIWSRPLKFDLDSQEIMVISLKEMGFSRGAQLEKIFKVAASRNLKIFSNEELPFLEKLPKISGFIACKSFISEMGNLVILKMVKESEFTYLQIARGEGHDYYSPDSIFIFKK